MQSKLWGVWILFACITAVFMPAAAYADIVYPSRLELIETEPGTLEVTFVLPVIQGKVLKARPVLPNSFIQIGEATTDGDYNTKTVKWRSSYVRDSLPGSRISVEGLSGSQVDLLLTIELLSGSKYRSTLSPVHAFYVIPEPMSPLEMISDAVIQGMRKLLKFGPLYLLLFLLSIQFPGRQKWVILAFSFVLAHATGQVINLQLVESITASRNSVALPWLPLPRYLSGIAALTISLFMAIRVTIGKSTAPGILGLYLSILLGLTYGLTEPGVAPLESLTYRQSFWFTGILNLGVLIGGVMALVLTVFARDIVDMIPARFDNAKRLIVGGEIAGIIAFGWLLFESSQLLIHPSLLPSMPPELMFFTMVCGLLVAKDNLGKLGVVTIGLAFIVGLACAGMAISPEISFGVIMSIAFLMLIILVFSVSVPPLFTLSLFSIAGLTTGIHLARYSVETLSYPSVQTAGNSLILIFLLLFFSQLAIAVKGRQIAGRNISTALWLALGFVGLGILLLNYSKTLVPTIRNTYVMGALWIPVLSLAVLLIGIWAWPKRRRIHQEMSLHRRKPVTSWVLIAFALTLLPFGSTTPNPWYVADAPDEKQARGILQGLLSGTYASFNTEDPELLFTRLSNTVSNSLIDDLYLDSRRRLSSGLREGSEVNVEEVEVLSTGTAFQASSPEMGYAFPSEWMVTARVRHLQHIHFRQNRYVGVITINYEDDKWKISNIALKSEDRKVIMASQR